MPVHCKKYLEGLAWISAFRSKKLDLFNTYTTNFRAFQVYKSRFFKISHYTAVIHS
jgi:hypothetical protein